MRPLPALVAVASLLALSLAVLGSIGLTTPPGYPYLHDEGSTVHAAGRIARGEHLYRDLLYFKAPLSYYGLGWLFRALPPDLETVRRGGAALLAVLVVGAALLGARLAAPGDRADIASWTAGGVVWALGLYVAAQRVTWHNSWCAALAALAAIALYTTSVGGGHRGVGRWMAVGLLVGVAALTKQTFGAALTVGLVTHRVLLLALTRDRTSLQPLVPIAVGAVGALGIWSSFMLREGALASFVELVLLYPITAPDLASSLAVPPPALTLSREAILFYGPLLLLVMVGAEGARRRRQGASGDALLAYAVVTLALYLTLIPTANYSHLRPLLPIALVAAAPALAAGLRLAPGRPSRLAGVGLLVAVVGASLWKTVGRLDLGTQVPLAIPGAGAVTADRATVRELQRLVAVIDDRVDPGAPIFVVPWGPMVYHFSARPNPTRTRIIGPGQWNGIVYQQEFIDDLEARTVALVVRVTRQPDPRFERLGDFAPLVARYLDRRFSAAASVGPYEVLARDRTDHARP